MWVDHPAPAAATTGFYRPPRSAAVAIAFVTALFGAVFARVPWPYIDLYNTLQRAEDLTWAATLRTAFSTEVEFRPIMVLATKLAYQVAGLHLWFYKLLVLVEFAVLLWALLILWRPAGIRRGLAAVVALACVIGLHTSRVLFLFLPLNGGTVSMILLVGAAIIAVEPVGRRMEWLLLPLALFSLLLLEFGILIVPVVVAAWWLSAPGVTWRGVAATVAGVAIYAMGRHLLGASVGDLSSPESGLGFNDMSPQQIKATFAHAPWLFWLYNVGSSLLTVLVSEPRDGKFKFISAVLRGVPAHWQWLHVMSSLVTTAVIAAVFLFVRTLTPRDRALAGIGLALVAGGTALGFLYTRDRIAMPAGLGYAVLVYVACSLLLERASVSNIRMALAGSLVAVLSLCWIWRAAEAGVVLRDRAWEYYLEWTVRYHHEGPERPLLAELRRTVLAHRPPDPRRDPAWTYRWIDRQFEPVSRD